MPAIQPTSRTTSDSPGTRRRNPDATRNTLLLAAFSEIHQHGFRGASLDRILTASRFTKGALYHHFGNKNELGHAVIDEVIRPWIEGFWKPLLESDDPITDAINLIQKQIEQRSDEELRFGCPFNNLVQEMSPVDKTFAHRLEQIHEDWRNGSAEVLRKAQREQKIRADVDTEAMADFLIASFEGCAGMAKLGEDPQRLRRSLQGLYQFLDSLRVA